MKRLIIQTGATVVIEGGAKGADSLAKEVAAELGVPVEEYKAEWGRYGNAAGPIRNKRMIEDGKPDLVLAFHKNINESKGTKNMVEQARKAGIKTIIIKEACMKITLRSAPKDLSYLQTEGGVG